MQQLIYFFQKFKYLLLFIVLQCIALFFTFNNLEFHKSKFVSSANLITGSFYNTTTSISSYFNLKSVNKKLVEENVFLRSKLPYNTYKNNSVDSVLVDTTTFYQKFTYTTAKVINNNYTNAFNYLTINKGAKQGLGKEMAVISSKGIVGVIDKVTTHYARAQSVLNKNTKINARLKNTGFFGTLVWDGKNYKTMQLQDIPRQAPVKIGDTIVTDGKSAIFPEGILIGYVKHIGNKNSINNAITVKLFNDMSAIGDVSIIKNYHKLELQVLENLENE